MDQFGHCHTKLDDGGFLYMDRQGSGHKSLDDGEVGQEVQKRTPRSSMSASAMLGSPEAPKLTKEGLAFHDGEVRQMRRKGLKDAMFGGKMHAHHPNTSARRHHHIGQPRRHN